MSTGSDSQSPRTVDLWQHYALGGPLGILSVTKTGNLYIDAAAKQEHLLRVYSAKHFAECFTGWSICSPILCKPRLQRRSEAQRCYATYSSRCR